jgi:hypothetical protein
MSQDDDSSSKGLVKLGLLIAGAGLVLGVEIPAWTALAAGGGVSAVGGAMWAAGRIESLLDDPRPVRLVQINAAGDPVAAWKLSEDKFAETEVLWGPLTPHGEDTVFQTFECYAFNEDQNVAVGTWRRHSVPGSELVGQFSVSDVEREIETLRGHLEPMARRFDELRSRLPGIVRELDYERSEQLNAALEQGHPEDVARRSIDDVIRDELPSECQPDAIRSGDLASLTEQSGRDDGNEWDGEGLELVVDADDPDAIEPAPDDKQMRNDGGL